MKPRLGWHQDDVLRMREGGILQSGKGEDRDD